jgi:hypothetical protein
MPPRAAATCDRRTRVSVNRAGAPAQPAPGDQPLLTWHTLGRSRDDFVSITSQPRALLQFTQQVRRLGCDQESSSGPLTRRSRQISRPTSVNGPGAMPVIPQLGRAGMATPRFPQPARQRPNSAEKSLFTPTSALRLGIKNQSSWPDISNRSRLINIKIRCTDCQNKICSLEFFEATTLQSLPRGSAPRSCLSKPPWLSSDFFNPSLPLVASPFPRHSLHLHQHLPAFGR